MRFDPFDLATVQVWHDGRRLPDAAPLQLKRYRDRRVAGTTPPAPPAPTGLNYLELLRQRQAAQQQQALGRVSYQLPRPQTAADQGGPAQ